MAGTKETPRQRMIGMMYLVLTALLALQVSSALIYKFQSLNESLEHAVSETTRWNNSKLTGISQEVKKRGNRNNEVALVNSAEEIGKESKQLIDYIEKVKKDLIKESGGYDDEGNLKGAKEETKVEVYMIGANKSGKGYALRKKLDEYVKFMNSKSAMNFSPLALDAKDDPMFKDNEDQKNKDFAELNFGQTPLVAGLAVLSEIQSRIASMEATTLAVLSGKIGANDFKFDVMKPMANPVSRIVPAGTKYEAQVFMTATSSTLKPVMNVGATSLQVDDNGVGKLSFTASGGNYDANGNLKKTWTGNIMMKKPDGTDTTYTITEEYVVAKPVIQVYADVARSLYRNCGNKLNIQVPALGNAYNPKITAIGASVITSTKKGFITVVPNEGASVSLKVSSDVNYIGEEKYGVKLIPLPMIECKVNNQVRDPLKGIPYNEVRSISVTPIADKEFKTLLPDDSYYKITEWKLTIARGKNGFGSKTYTTQNVNIPDIAQQLKANDRLIVEVVKVLRKTYKGDWEEVKLPKHLSIHTVQIN